MATTPDPLRAAAEAPGDERVLVVGAGAIGLGIAWRLAAAGRDVCVVERDTPGSGASCAAAGMLAPVAEIDFVEEALIALKRESLARYPAFCVELTAASGIDVDYREQGTLAVAIDRDDAEELRRHHDYQRELGLPVRWLSGDEAREIEPYLSPYVQAAVSIPGDHSVDNVQLVAALEQAARKAGATILGGAPVDRVLHDGAAVRGVQVGEHTLAAGTVVLAAGCWSGTIDGLDGPLAPPVRPVKGQMLSLRMPDPPVLAHVVRAPDCYLVPRSDGRLIVGATSEELGFDEALTAGGMFDLLRGAYETLPITYELALERSWTGLRPASRDNDPILGHTALRGLIMATGHYRNGILLTPITADTIASAVLDGVDRPEIAPFALARFHA